MINKVREFCPNTLQCCGEQRLFSKLWQRVDLEEVDPPLGHYKVGLRVVVEPELIVDFFGNSRECALLLATELLVRRGQERVGRLIPKVVYHPHRCIFYFYIFLNHLFGRKQKCLFEAVA